MVIFKIHTDLVIIKNDKALDKVFVVTMLPTFNEEIKDLHGPLAFEKLSKYVEKKNVD